MSTNAEAGARPVYLDYAAAAPADERVIAVMAACLRADGAFANPHARDHVYGWEAAEAVENAREQVARLIGASPLEIVFTSGATESNNLAVFGLAQALRERGDRRRHIITSQIEHKAVLEACALLGERGYRITFLKPRADGVVTPEALERELDDDTFLVSLAQANSVLGSVSDIYALAALARSRGAYFHSDLAQSVGWEKNDLQHSDISLASLTAEKVCGPKGAGALYVKQSLPLKLKAQIYGGGQERGLRGGTVATHQAAGMGKAFEILLHEADSEKARLLGLRERLLGGLKGLEGLRFNGSPEHHVPGIVSLSFEGVDGQMLLPSLPRLAVSTGSACSSGDLRPSYILKAVGLSDELARASLRISFGRFTTAGEIDTACGELWDKIPKLRRAGSMWQVRKSGSGGQS